MAQVEPLDIPGIDAVHCLSDVRLWCLDEKVIVVPHQAVRMADEPIAMAGTFNEPEEARSIVVGEEYGSAQVAATRDVIDAFGELLAASAGHALNGTETCASCPPRQDTNSRQLTNVRRQL
jgi:hypothetical protein